MTPKQVANRLIDIVQSARDTEALMGAETAFNDLKNDALVLASELIALEGSYGHAAKLHQLTSKPPEQEPRNPDT